MWCIHMEEKKSLIMFVDSRLPLNIYLFNQSTGRFKFGLGEVRGHREIPQLCLQRTIRPGQQELQGVKCGCAVSGRSKPGSIALNSPPFERFV